MLLKKSGQKRSKFATCLARRKRWWQRETRSWKKKTRFPTLCFCPPGFLLAFQFDLLKKKKTFMRYLLNDERYYAHLVCVLLPSRIPAGISIWSQRWQINRCWKYRFHFVCFSFKFLNIYYRFNLRLKLGQIRSCGCDICQWQTLIVRGALEMQIFW